jgi:Zn-dependent peptidase ImmA (M78 family)
MIEEYADSLRRRYGTDPRDVLERLGVEVVEHPLEGRIKEIYFGDYVVLKSGIAPPYREYYLAHALGHHVIHKKGNCLYCHSVNHLTTLKKESEAEDFAACFLIGRKAAARALIKWGDCALEAAADNLHVAPEVLARRIQVLARVIF